ncbi:MAG TPA: DUF6089 family protein [Cytophagaceae bacterium]|jgi:hypothetical protein|nr:DUF6089 family protein [Cytophagaceae bacterium]
MNRLYSVVLLVLLSFLLSFSVVFEANAQKFPKKYKYWSIGGSLNTMNYVGELDPGPSFASPGLKFTRWNLGLDVTRRMGTRVTLRGAVSYGRIAGDDFVNASYSYKGGPRADIRRKSRNLDFTNNILEVKGDVIIDFIEHRGKYQKRPDFVPYMFVGLAYFHHNPQTTYNGQTVNLRDYHTEGEGLLPGAHKQYSLNQIALPIGLGLRYKLAPQWDLAFEIGWRFTTTDYLDDVSGKYPDPQALYNATGSVESVTLAYKSALIDPNNHNFDGIGSNDITFVDKSGVTHHLKTYGDAVPGGPRGNPKRKDAYIVTGFHLTYIIPQKVICPKFR